MAETQVTSPTTDNSLTEKPTEKADEGSLLTAGVKTAPQAEKPTSERSPWMDQLEADLKTDAALSKFKTPSALARSYKELEGRLGAAIFKPGEGATEEEVAAFHKKMGRPDKPEDYTIKSALPKDALSDEFLGTLKGAAHKIGLSQDQAAVLMSAVDSIVKPAIEKVQGQQAEAQRLELGKKTQAKASAKQALSTEWADKFDANLAVSRGALLKLADADTVKAVNDSGLGDHPGFIKLLYKIGKEIEESPFVTEGSPGGAEKSAADILYPTK